MKTLKLKTLLFAIPLLITGLTGCGGGGGEQGGESSKQQGGVSSQQQGDVSSQQAGQSSQQQGGQSSQQQGGASSQQAGQSSATGGNSQGGGQTSQATGQSSATGGNSQSTNPSAVTIKFWHTFGQTVVDGIAPRVKAFHDAVLAHDNVDITVDMKYQGGYDDIAKKISDGFSIQNTPTIAVAYPDNVADYIEIGKSADTEFVVNLDRFIDDPQVGFGKEAWLSDKYDEDDFIEDFYNEGKAYVLDGTYSLPFLKSTEIMFYNLDMLMDIMSKYKPEIAGVNNVKRYMSRITWGDFVDLCSFIKTDIIPLPDYKGLEVPMWYDSDANLFITKMYQNNIPYSSIENGRGKIGFQDQTNFNKTVDMLDGFRQLYAGGIMTTKGIEKTYGSDYFTGEKCVFSIGSSGGSGYNFPQANAFELGVCRVPVSNNDPLYVSQGPTLAMFNDSGLSAAVNATAQKYAWKLMKYLTNGQVNAEICVNGSEGYVPVRYSAYETAFFQDFMDEGERYAMCYRVVVDDVNSEAGYLVSPAFKGSAALRNECGTLLTASLTAANKQAIPALVTEAINAARLKM